MIKLKVTRVDYNNNNTPILYKDEIEKFAYDTNPKLNNFT